MRTDFLQDVLSRFRPTSAAPSPADASGGHQRPRPLPIPFGDCTDVRDAVRGASSAAVLDYDRVYAVEPTVWGLDSGFQPPPSPPPAPTVPASAWPPVPAVGPQAPPIPRIVPRHPPQPFRIFDGTP